jgi:UDP-N-acetyl-D-mannosaminuronic acid transferase (WecB/TagA/CpsF family)
MYKDINYNTVNIFGINFIYGEFEDALYRLNQGALMVVPAAPALAMINSDAKYHEALQKSDFAIPDSGFMILILRLFKGIKLKKLSGLEFLRKFLNDEKLKESNDIFFIDPTLEDSLINNNYLRRIGIIIEKSHHYVAPIYNNDNIIDTILLDIVEKKKPKYIIINLGGGVQERLGLYLKVHLSYCPGIICTGAAIAFLTGRQANIPNYADKFLLGWLYRCIENPKKFIPRYLKGFLLLPLLIKELIIKQ